MAYDPDKPRLDEPDPFISELDEREERGSVYSSHLTENASSDAHCKVCHDTGWVSLQITQHHMGVPYDEFAAPCTLCEVGDAIARCLASGIDYRFGAGKPKEQPWRGQSVDTTYSHTDVLATYCARCGPHPLTWDEYLGTDVGQADPHAPAARVMIEDARRHRRPLRAEDTPEQLGKGLTPAAAPAAGGGRTGGAPGAGAFAALGDSIAPDPTKEAHGD